MSKRRDNPFSRCVYVVKCGPDNHGCVLYKVEVNIPYVPSLLTCNRDFYSEREAIGAAINIEAKLNRLVREWERKRK